MSRIRIQLPNTFTFSTDIPVRITDLNYGGHMGNDALLSLMHEARMQFLASKGYTEMKLNGVSMIMSDVGIEFKAEAFYGDILKAELVADNFTKVSFDLFYRFTRQADSVLIAVGKTGMVCFDYDKRKIAMVPDGVKEMLMAR
jgi:acyl-CoA thioester hydrolase